MEVEFLPAATTAAPPTVPVWDRFLRLFHWGLVAGISLAFATSLILPPSWTLAHAVVGTLCAVLVLVRIVWGVWGPTYARFRTFVRGPRHVWAHARGLLTGTAHRHRGHNPAGAAMIVAVLAAVLALGVTGAVTLGGALRFGPLASLVNYAAGSATREVHEVIAYTLLGLILAHTAGVILESRRTHENLAKSMLTGRKEARTGDDVAAPVRPRPALATAVSLAGIVLLTAGAAPLAARAPAGVPDAALDATYKKECGECHIAYHPSLMPAARWGAVMDGLSRHFGENAAIPAATAQAIRTYLTANAAETVDTLPSNELSRANPSDPLRISATPFWQHMHEDIDSARFKAKPVRSKSNCGACHGDADSGMFQPWNIHVPAVQP